MTTCDVIAAVVDRCLSLLVLCADVCMYVAAVDSLVDDCTCALLVTVVMATSVPSVSLLGDSDDNGATLLLRSLVFTLCTYVLVDVS